MRRKQIDKARFAELEILAKEFARGDGFKTLSDSIAGAAFAITSLNGHLFLTDDKLNEDGKLGMMIAIVFLEELAKMTQ